MLNTFLVRQKSVSIPDVRTECGPGIRVSHRLALMMLAVATWAYPVLSIAQTSFTDVTAGSGAEYAGESYGASWGYYNDDVLPDLFVNHHRANAALLVNLANDKFSNRAHEVDIWQSVSNADQHGGTWADFDNDGDQDLFITTGSKNNSQFLQSNGNFLSDQISNYTFDVMSWGGRMPMWFDFTHDGLLDLAIAVKGGKFHLHEQVAGDFAKVNFQAGNQCDDNEYGQLADFNRDGQLDWMCVSQDFSPDRIYDYSSMPFIDATGLLPTVPNVIDSVVADFDGDLESDVIFIRGKTRVSGAEATSAKTLEAHLIANNATEIGTSFQTNGDVTVELHWSARNINNVFIGSSGVHPETPIVGEPIIITLSPDNPDHVGIMPHNQAVTRGVYVGYEPGTNTWTFLVSGGSGGEWSYTYSYFESTNPISNITDIGLQALDLPFPVRLFTSGTGSLVDTTAAAGLSDPVACVSGVSADFDNDMDMDLYLVCRNAVSNAANRVYLNDGNGVFTLVASPGDAAGPVGTGLGLGENVAISDYNVDGFVDLFVTNGLKLYPEPPAPSAGGPDLLLKNDGNANKWLEIDLVGITSNRDAVGARVLVTAGGVSQRKDQNGGYNRWSQNDKRMHFGLANNLLANIQVFWPSGQVDLFINVAAGHLYEVVEGGSISVVEVPTSTDPSPCGAAGGAPSYDKSIEQGVFLWLDCASGAWQVRVTGGGGVLNAVGNVQSEVPFSSVNPISVEGNDVLDFTSNPSKVQYSLNVGGSGQDGFSFTFPGGSATCFHLALPSGMPILVGTNKTPLSPPFDLGTLGACTNVQPTVSAANVQVSENDISGLISFDLTLSFASTQPVSVDVFTVNGTAAAPNDFVQRPLTTVNFGIGQTSQPVDISIIDDNFAEGDESFVLQLSNPVNAVIGTPQVTGSILDNEPSPCNVPVYDKNAEQAAYLWKDCASGVWSMTVAAGPSAATFVGSILATENFTGVTEQNIEPSDFLDYTTNPATIDFALKVANGGGAQDSFDFSMPASASGCVAIDAPVGVAIYVGAGKIAVTSPFDLSTLSACTSLPPEISISDVTVNENIESGVASLAVTLSKMSSDVVKVNVTTMNNLATDSDDYVALPTPTTVKFLAGQVTKNVNIPILDDALAEGDEDFLVQLSNPTNGVISKSLGIATIADNEASPCGAPPINPAVDRELFVWKDCGGQTWHVYSTAGGTSGHYAGSLVSNQALIDVTPISLGGSDVLVNSNPLIASFNTSVYGSGNDHFTFDVSDDSMTVCLTITAPSSQLPLVGPARTPMSEPLDLSTLSSCS